jgi:hypothetical protein
MEVKVKQQKEKAKKEKTGHLLQIRPRFFEEHGGKE